MVDIYNERPTSQNGARTFLSAGKLVKHRPCDKCGTGMSRRDVSRERAGLLAGAVLIPKTERGHFCPPASSSSIARATSAGQECPGSV